jgi:hypothetical protein
MVKHGKPVVVLPLLLEFIRNEDGTEKQDGELLSTTSGQVRI